MRKPLHCPDCGARTFYVKDPDDRFTISEFTLEHGRVEYLDDDTAADRVPVFDDSEIFCDRCSWHDRFRVIKPVQQG